MDEKGSGEPVIEVEGLTVRRGGAEVIRGATFTVERGDYIGIVGPNGGGKTTLIKAVLGIIPRAGGTIRLFGEDLDSFSDWGRVAYVAQDSINFDEEFPLSVRELVGLGRINKGNLGRRLSGGDWERVEDALGFMDLKEISDRRIGHLSGGQKQRVFVAKAMVRNPDILILDEPVTGIDAETSERFYMKLSDLNLSRGTTILNVSHDLTSVFCRMSKVLAVNREVHEAEITPEMDPNVVLRDAYGEHFHFVFSDHVCEGMFRSG